MPFPFFRMDNNGALKALTSIPGWQWDALNGEDEASAVTAYLSSAWLMRAVQVRAEAIPTARLVLLDEDGEPIESHPLLDLLHNVNEEWNASDLWRYTEAGLCLYGAGFWQKVRIGDGRPTQLRYLNPSTVKAIIDARGVQGFERDKLGERYTRDDVVYFRGQYDPASDLTGLALAKWGARAAIAELNAEKYLSAFFANYALPTTVLTTEQQLAQPEAERMMTWWQKLFRGPTKAHKTGLLWGGVKPVPLGYPLSDLALKEVRDAVHQSISTALGVPELLISPTNAADLTPVRMAQRLLYENTIAPRWSWYAEVLNSELLTDFPDLVARKAELSFDYSGLPAMQENADAKAARLSGLVAAGIIRADVAARELGYTEDDVPDEIELPENEPDSDSDDAPVKSVTVASDADELKAYRAACLSAVKARVAMPLPCAGAEAARIANEFTATPPKSAGDVRRVFAAHWPASEEPTAAVVIAELRRAREALAGA